MRNKLLILAKLLVTGGLITMLAQQVDIAETWRQASGMSGWLLLAALFSLLLQPLVAAARWQRVLHQLEMDISFMATVRLLFIGIFFNQALPSSLGGDALRGYYLTRQGFGLAKAVIGVLLDRVMGMVGIVVLALVTWPLFVDRVSDSMAITGMMLVIAVAMGGIVVLLLLDLLPQGLQRWRMVRGATVLARESRRIILSLQPGVGLILLSILVHLFSVAALWLLAQGMGLNVGWIELLIILPVVTLFMTLPISIAGWGVREGVMVVGLGYMGVAAEGALALSLLYGILLLVAALPGGIVWLMAGHHSGTMTMKEELEQSSG